MTTELGIIDANELYELISKLAFRDQQEFCLKTKSPTVLAWFTQSEFIGANVALRISENPNISALIEQKLARHDYFHVRRRIAERTEDKCLLIELLQDSTVTVKRAAEKRLKELLSLV